VGGTSPVIIRRLEIRNVGDMDVLFNAVSNTVRLSYNTGDDIITNEDTVEVTIGTYHCNESGSNCVDSEKMLATQYLYV